MLAFLTKSMMFVHMFVGLILVGIILLQRGRGGGLAGAFGGMGGQSAFGTKAGDVFTKITIWIATIWIVMGCVCVVLASNFKATKTQKYTGGNAANIKKAAESSEKKSIDDEKADDSKKPQPENPPSVKPGGSKPDGETPKDEVKPESTPADTEKPDDAGSEGR